MGLLDALISGMTEPTQDRSEGPGNSAGGGAGGGFNIAALLPILMQLLASRGQGGAAAGGGDPLSSLIDQFQRAGMGGQMNSWIGTGQNQPISPDQLMEVFGRGQLEQMAGQSGMDLGQLSGGLSKMLPQFIDQMTPGGQMPSPGGIDDALADLSRMMPRG